MPFIYRIKQLALLLYSLLLMPSAALSSEQSAYATWMNEEVTLHQTGIAPLTIDDLNGRADPFSTNAKPHNLSQRLSEKTALERSYSERTDEALQQFGYSLFSKTGDSNISPNALKPSAQIDSTYLLGTGDTLDIVVRGQSNQRHTIRIDEKGQLILPDFPPLQAAGRTLGEVEKQLKAESDNLHNTELFVTLSGIRQIGVLVVGHVAQPGRKNLSAFHTVLDAIEISGGIEKDGSLRTIKLIRNGKNHPIDLYQLLMHEGGDTGKILQDGDRIIVPSIGPTVAVSGFVKRPGIFEIKPGEKLLLNDMLLLAGHPVTPGNNRFIKMHFTQNGTEQLTDIVQDTKHYFTNGMILSVKQAKAARTEEIILSGHTRAPGAHALDKNQTLSNLLHSSTVMGPDIYPLIGVIERFDKRHLTKQLIPFSPRQILAKTSDRALENSDKVILFSTAQIRGLNQQKKEKEASLQTISFMEDQEDQNTKHDSISDPLLVSFLNERAAFVRGAVRVSGSYPIADGTTLDNLIAAAGGLTREANTSNIELTSRLQGEGHQRQGRSGTQRIIINYRDDNPAIIEIGTGDTIRVNQLFDRVSETSVGIFGEVENPGRYDLMPGDTLSSLLERAGGLSPYAFPSGTIFSRASERKSEENRYIVQARDLELKLASSLQAANDNKKPDMAQITAMQSLITEMKHAKAVGRITVESDPGILKTTPEQDILLEAGDKIYVPKRPLTVRVAGEVLSPAALKFTSGKDAQDYIREAGGTTYYADRNRAFVVYPDGSAQPLHVTSWEHRAVKIPPGSTIIVPRDPKPFDFIEGAERISQILANLAISGLYIDAIGDDD